MFFFSSQKVAHFHRIFRRLDVWPSNTHSTHTMALITCSPPSACVTRSEKIKAKKKRINVKRTGVQVGRKREDKRGKAKQLHMDIGNIRNAVFALCYTQPKNARLFFPLFFFILFFCPSWHWRFPSCILRSVQWLNAGNHWLRRDTHKKKTAKIVEDVFEGEFQKKKKREAVKHKLHRLRKVYNPGHIPWVAENAYCKLACVFVC